MRDDERPARRQHAAYRGPARKLRIRVSDAVERRAPHTAMTSRPRSLPRPLLWLAAVLALVVVFVAVFDWNWLKGPLERGVTQATGRAFHIEGDLHVRLGRAPVVSMDRLTFANAPWGEAPHMARAERIEVAVELLPLLRREVVIPRLKLVRPDISLERARDGQRNWVLAKKDDGGESAPPVVRHLEIDQGRIAFIDAPSAFEVRADVRTAADKDGASGTAIDFEGRYRDVPFTGSASMGPVLQLQQTDVPNPIRFRLKSSQIGVSADGTVTNLQQLGEVDVAFKIAGTDLGKLHPAIPLPLPSTKPYAVSGRLQRTADHWRFTGIDGSIGKSDIHGDASYLIREPRAQVRAKLRSNLLDIADLGPLIGVRPKAEREAKAAAAGKRGAKDTGADPKSPAAPSRVLPNVKFNANALRAIDVDVTLDAKRVARPEALAIDDLTFRVLLEGGQLKLAPLRFGFAGGDIVSSIGIDARKDLYDVTLDTRFRSLRVDQLFPKVDWSKNSIGRVGGHLKLAGQGTSIASMLGTSSGRLELVASGGEMSSLLIEAIGLDGGEVLRYLLGRDQRSPLRCGVAAFDIRKGQAQSEVIVLDTDDTRIDGTGKFDLEQETLALRFEPKPKDVSVGVLRAPIFLQGTFGDPGFGVEKKTLIARGAAAVGLGLLTPLAALIPLVETGPGEDADCKALLAAQDAKPPPPPTSATPTKSR